MRSSRNFRFAFPRALLVVSAYIKRDQAASMVNKANIAAWTQQIKKCGQAATKSVNKLTGNILTD